MKWTKSISKVLWAVGDLPRLFSWREVFYCHEKDNLWRGSDGTVFLKKDKAKGEWNTLTVGKVRTVEMKISALRRISPQGFVYYTVSEDIRLPFLFRGKMAVRRSTEVRGKVKRWWVRYGKYITLKPRARLGREVRITIEICREVAGQGGDVGDD